MYLTNNAPWFAFLVHPRDIAELLTMPGGSLLRAYSATDIEFADKARSNPPAVCDDVAFMNSVVRGEIIGIPHLPETILTPEGNRAVIEAAGLGAQRGARVIGLGALTAPATAGGQALLRHIPATVTLINGNGLTAAVAHQNVCEAAIATAAAESARVAVLGATGSVGYAVSRLLADESWQLTLIGPEERRVRRIFADLLDRVYATADLDEVGKADVVLSLTNAPSALLKPEMLNEGAIVIDIAQPHNVADDAVATFAERGIAVVRGGVVQIPGYSCSRDFRLESRRDCFACLAETYLIAREGLRQHSVGRPSAEYARAMAELADYHGVMTRPLEMPDVRSYAAGIPAPSLTLSST